MKFLRNLAFKAKLKVNQTLSSFTDTIKQIIVLIATLIAMAWMAVFFYGTFYYYYVPVVSHERPVYFHFRACESGVGMCSFPLANISFANDEQTEVFNKGQSYKIVLDIDLPESDVNRKLGMFMVEMRLYNKKGITVHTAARTASLHYKSELLHVIETLAFSPFFLFGYMHQKQVLHIELFPEFIENAYNPSVGAVVEVQSLKVELYTARLNIFAQFSGVRYFLYYWPITSAVIGISWNFILFCFITALSWYQFLLPNEQNTSKKVVKINLSGKKKVEGSPKKGIKALSSSADSMEGVTETVGAAHNEEETSLLSSSSSSSSALSPDSGIRLRQTHSAT